MAEEICGEDGVSTFFISYTTIVSRQILVTKLTFDGEPRPSQLGRVSGGPCWLGRELTATKFALNFGTVKYWNWI